MYVPLLSFFFYVHIHSSIHIGLEFAPFEAWKDVREMLNEGSVDVTCLNELWEEALRERDKEKISKKT